MAFYKHMHKDGISTHTTLNLCQKPWDLESRTEI